MRATLTTATVLVIGALFGWLPASGRLTMLVQAQERAASGQT